MALSPGQDGKDLAEVINAISNDAKETQSQESTGGGGIDSPLDRRGPGKVQQQNSIRRRSFKFRSPIQATRRGSINQGGEDSIASGDGAWWRIFGIQYQGTQAEEVEESWISERWAAYRAYVSRFAATCWEQKIVPIIAFLFFIVLCACGVATVFWYYNRDEENRRMSAQAIATSLASSLAAQIDLVLLPMFVLAIDATNNQAIFQVANEVKSWPFQTETHREMQPLLDATSSFQAKASSLLGLVNASSAIISLQLAPCGIVTFVNPMEGNEKAFGHDVFADPLRNPDAVRTVRAKELVMAGPIPLVQGGNMMIGRLPIFVDEELGVGLDTRDIPQIGETVYPGKRFWGFSVSLVNFRRLMAETKFEAELKNHKMKFNLTRTNRELAEDGSTVETKKVVAASTVPEGEEAEEVLGVEVDVEFHNELMTLTVTCPNGCKPAWRGWAIGLVVVGSSVLSWLLLVFLVTRAQHLSLLHKMLPRKAISRINRGKQVIDDFASVSIFFSDIVGFTSMAGSMQPVEVMKLLNDLYMEFDKLVAKHDVYKVETIGDAYMVVGGAPTRLPGPESAYRVAKFALDALELVQDWETNGRKVAIRCGVHSGPVVAGVVGTAMPRYCFFGDTVNTASRMESTSQQGRLQMSSSAVGNLQVWCQQNQAWPFKLKQRSDRLNVKGKGHMETYWVERQAAGAEFSASMVDCPPIIAETDSAASSMHNVRAQQLSQHMSSSGSGRDPAQLETEPQGPGTGTLVGAGAEDKGGALRHVAVPEEGEDAAGVEVREAEAAGVVLGAKERAISIEVVDADVMLVQGRDNEGRGVNSHSSQAASASAQSGGAPEHVLVSVDNLNVQSGSDRWTQNGEMTNTGGNPHVGEAVTRDHAAAWA